MKIGNRIANLRSEKNLSQANFAKIIGVSQSTVGQWETGQRNIPTDTLLRVADYFGVSTDYLLGHKVSSDDKSIDLKDFLRNQNSMSYNGKELSERDINTLSRVIGAYLEGDED